MSPKASVPDAWDDDNWESLADEQAKKPESARPAPQILSNSERRAEHVKAAKQLWEEADKDPTPEFSFLEARRDVPLKQEFKAPVKLLSRKPSPRNPARSLDDEEGSDEEAKRMASLTLAERQEKAQREREEKQRRYNEARERILGSASGTAAEEVTRRSVSPKKDDGFTGRGKGKPRGGIQGSSPKEQSPARPGPQNRRLFDPSFSPKPTSGSTRRSESSEQGAQMVEPTRQPRGPDGSGRGGFGFGPRGNS